MPSRKPGPKKTRPKKPPQYVESKEAVRMHSELSKVKKPKDFTDARRNFLAETGRRRVDEVLQIQLSEFVQSRLEPLVDRERLETRDSGPAPPFLEQAAVQLPEHELPLPTLNDVTFAASGGLCVEIPWGKGNPQALETEPTKPPSLFKSRIQQAKVIDGKGDLSLGVAAGWWGQEWEYPAPQNYFFFAGSSAGANVSATYFFPFPPSESPLDVTVEVGVEAWRKERQPLTLWPAGRYGVAGAFADATMSLAGPTLAAPGQSISRRRFIEAAKRGDGVFNGQLYRTFDLKGAITLAPGAQYIVVSFGVRITALYARGNGTGYADVDLLPELSSPKLRYYGSNAGPLRVSVPRLCFNWR